MEDIYRVLRLYVAKDGGREFLLNPFIQDGFVYASNGHILIRIKDESLLDDPMYANKSEPQLSHLFKNISDIGQITMKSIEELLSKIELTDETRTVGNNVRCPECYGEGIVEWEYDRWTKDFDCPACNGSGYIDEEREELTGNKIINPEDGILIIDRYFKVKYVNVLLYTMNFFNVDTVTIQGKSDNNLCMIFNINSKVSVLMMPYMKDLSA